MSAFDPRQHSIFEGRHEGQCNACVGENGCPDFETYALGYFDAARMILEQVLDPKKCLVQDQLVYPTLFNFRHGIELSLKHVSKKLHACELILPNLDQNTHDLRRLWTDFKKQAKLDRRLLKIANELEPAILQVHETDPLAQEFRYSERRDGVPSLEGHSIIDLATVLDLVNYTASRLDTLFGLTYQIAKERGYGSYTSELNREELEQLSIDLPNVSTWEDSEKFTSVRAKWMKEYQLSSGAFTRAVNFIKSHREFAGNIGIRSQLSGIDDEQLESILKAAKKLQYFDRQNSDSPESFVFHEKKREFFEANVELAPSLVTEINTLFYLARDRYLSDAYTDLRKKFGYSRVPVDASILWGDFAHVFEKTNFIECICKSLKLVGRQDLADRLERQLASSSEEIRPDQGQPYDDA